MCHISLLTSNQIEALASLPYRFRRQFEAITNGLTARDRRGTLAAYQTVMDAAGKGGEKAEEAVAEAKVEMPQGIYVRF